jgi:hypothetical protein
MVSGNAIIQKQAALSISLPPSYFTPNFRKLPSFGFLKRATSEFDIRRLEIVLITLGVEILLIGCGLRQRGNKCHFGSTMHFEAHHLPIASRQPL